MSKNTRFAGPGPVGLTAYSRDFARHLVKGGEKVQKNVYRVGGVDVHLIQTPGELHGIAIKTLYVVASDLLDDRLNWMADVARYKGANVVWL